MNRRTFLKQSTALGTGITILKSGILRAGNSPNEKLNIAVIGVAGRGGANMNNVKSENIVALCDVNAQNLANAAKQFIESSRTITLNEFLWSGGPPVPRVGQQVHDHSTTQDHRLPVQSALACDTCCSSTTATGRGTVQRLLPIAVFGGDVL